MKKRFALLAALLLIAATLAGCITIIQDGSKEAPASESTEESATEKTEEEPQSVVESESEEESSTEDEGGHHIPPEPPTDSSGMRYTYSWVSGLYKFTGTESDGFLPEAEILLYENGLFAAYCSVPYSASLRIGSYTIAGDTISLHTWFSRGGDVALTACDVDSVIGINMDGTLIDGSFYQAGGVYNKQSEKDREMFDKENNPVRLLMNGILANEHGSNL